jgi:hypothetical protein
VKALKAHVHKGQIVLDEPAELLEGLAVEVVLPDQDVMSAADLAELDEALDESRAQMDRGELEDAGAFAVRLAARS